MHVQPLRTLLELQSAIAAEQRDGLHRSASESLTQRMDHDFILCGPLNSDGIERVPLGGEPKIFGCVVCCVGIVE